MNGSHELGVKTTASILTNLWHDRRVRIAVGVIFLIGMGVMTAVGKKLHPSMSIPGSSAVWWLSFMVLGKMVVRQRGAGVLMGATVALYSLPVGLNHAMLYNLGLYGVTGVALDAVSEIRWVNIRHPLGALFCGLSAHLVKWCFIVGMAMTSSVTKHFLIVGVFQSLGLHLAFGAAAGIAAWIPYYLYKKSRREGEASP